MPVRARFQQHLLKDKKYIPGTETQRRGYSFFAIISFLLTRLYCPDASIRENLPRWRLGKVTQHNLSSTQDRFREDRQGERSEGAKGGNPMSVLPVDDN